MGLQAREYHVMPTGADHQPGTVETPLRTINAAAQLALPGDTVTVHAGVYREWVNPLNGGESDSRRILYRAAEGEKVELKGSEVVDNWEKVKPKSVISVMMITTLVFVQMALRFEGAMGFHCNRKTERQMTKRKFVCA